MIDPLTQVVTLLQPRALYSKVVSGSGAWRVCRSDIDQPYYSVIVEGSCCVTIDRRAPVALQAGDFVFVPSAKRFSMSSLDLDAPEEFETTPVALLNGEFRLGDGGGTPDVQILVGSFEFDSPDAAILLSLLPKLVHVRGEPRLATIVKLVVEESRSQRPARDLVLSRLIEVLLIEAFRSTTGAPESPGLVRGLADDRIALAIRRLHEDPGLAWTVERLAGEANLSRSAFYERFTRAVGMAPMEYLFIFRMALAKTMLGKEDGGSVAEVADRLGYGSASAFSTAFTRHVGTPPARYARSQRA